AEWEYACRNGEKSDKYSWGNNLPSGNIADEALKAKYPDWKIWTGYNDGYVYTAPVGSYKVSEAGLYDMSGNVWEWVEDVYAADAYSKHSRNNPIYTGSGERRVYRGGGWSRNPQNVRCSLRYYYTPGFRNNSVGFRLKYVK
ncbi:MAG: formylglycine-generating enzyme family protein, partial [Nitrospirae bacterium YQR-1]